MLRDEDAPNPERPKVKFELILFLNFFQSYEILGEEMQCLICIDYLYQPVTLVPCLHNVKALNF